MALPIENSSPPCEQIIANVEHTKDVADVIKYSSLIIDILQEVDVKDIVCYGIGCFGTCYISRQQLALLLHIASVKQARRVLVYDPILSSQENAALEKLGCICIDKNEACKRKVEDYTLFYMPHCGRAMYNNILWANWSPEQLSKVALIGNSFHSYLER